MVAWTSFVVVFALSFFGFVFTWFPTAPLAYLFLVYWSVFAALFLTTLNLLTFAFIKLLKSKRTDSSGGIPA
jgi:hypothetical protein